MSEENPRGKATHDEVAVTYLNALASGRHPAKAVARRFGISDRTATNWIALAKHNGSLVPAPYFPTRKIIDVAAALGVSVDDLRNAVLDHADGDLRIR